MEKSKCPKCGWEMLISLVYGRYYCSNCKCYPDKKEYLENLPYGRKAVERFLKWAI